MDSHKIIEFDELLILKEKRRAARKKNRISNEKLLNYTKKTRSPKKIQYDVDYDRFDYLD